MPAAAIGAVGSIAGGLIGAKGAKVAGKQQAAASAQATQAQLQAAREQQDFLQQGRDQALGYLDQYGGRQEQMLSQIPGRVAPIYERGYQNLQSLSRTGASQFSDTLGQGYGAAKDIYGNLLPQAQDIIAGGQGKAEAALTGYDPELLTQEQLGALGQQREAIGAAGQPYQEVGQQALGAYAQTALDPFSSPLYQQQVAQGQEALQERLATMGLSQSSAAIEKEQDMIQNLQAQAIDRATGMQGQLAQMGQGQTQLQQQLGTQLAGQEADVYGQAGSLASQMEAQRAAQLANLYQSGTAQELGALTGTAEAQAQLTQQEAGMQAANQADLYSRLAQAEAGKTADMANMEQQAALNLANYYGGMGAQRANIVTGTGQAQASAAGATGTNIANIAMQQGQNAAGAKMAQYGALAGGVRDLTNIGANYAMGNFGKSKGNIYNDGRILSPMGTQPKKLGIND